MIDFKLLAISVVLLAMLTVGQVYYLEKGPSYNITDKAMNITGNLTESLISNFEDSRLVSIRGESFAMQRIINIIYYWIEYGVKVLVELMAFGMVFGFENPDFNWRGLLDLFILMFKVCIGVFLFKPVLITFGIVAAIVIKLVDFVKKLRGESVEVNKNDKNNESSK